MHRDNFLKLKNMLFIFINFSIMGWCYESILFFTRKLPFENRGFLFGPYLPIYGLGSIILLLICFKFFYDILSKSNKILKLFLIFAIMIIVSTTVEYIIGSMLLKNGIRLWDYSNRVYNLNGIICVGASVRFGILGVLIYYLLFPIYDIIFKKYGKFVFIFNILFSTTMLLDFCFQKFIG